jgi:GcrA cell cycle regulator
MTYWNPTNETQLRALVDAGNSALEIAKALGGISRNAIIGKCTRMGLTLKRSTGAAQATAASAARPRTPKQQAAKPPPRVVKLAPVPPPSPQRLTLEHLGRDQCKWPGAVQQDGQWTFCGAPQHDGYPYCTHHARIAYRPKEY